MLYITAAALEGFTVNPFMWVDNSSIPMRDNLGRRIQFDRDSAV